ncbi:hypothetical protein NPIL_676571 [Nephila pilipes]|uniref:Uncharacterized protein n=1 Tax=Nephila pilipes TaxID=299642 RepID=A0A8X6MWK8_NEPPI|nr:hypothetical protein NPIL_676571 [Nephila pilipes]
MDKKDKNFGKKIISNEKSSESKFSRINLHKDSSNRTQQGIKVTDSPPKYNEIMDIDEEPAIAMKIQSSNKKYSYSESPNLAESSTCLIVHICPIVHMMST